MHNVMWHSLSSTFLEAVSPQNHLIKTYMHKITVQTAFEVAETDQHLVAPPQDPVFGALSSQQATRLSTLNSAGTSILQTARTCPLTSVDHTVQVGHPCS